MQKNSSLEYWGLFQGRLYLKILDKVEFEKSIDIDWNPGPLYMNELSL